MAIVCVQLKRVQFFVDSYKYLQVTVRMKRSRLRTRIEVVVSNSG